MPKEKSGDTKKSIDAIVDEIKGKFGEGMIMKLGDVRKVDVEAIPSG